MSELRLHAFSGDGQGLGLYLPFELETLIADWAALRPTMARSLPDSFSRDEWAYLLTFTGAGELRAVYTETFGEMRPAGEQNSRHLEPRGPVALWLPNNVSLLGPLTLILTSLTGNPLWVKAGSRSENLTQSLRDWVLAHGRPGPLADYLEQQVTIDAFPRTDPRHKDLAAGAKVRIVFGSDAAAEAIEALPHPEDSVGFGFIDRQSQAWMEASASDEDLIDFLKVFAVYGRAGCTSPRKLIVIDGNEADAREVRERLLSLWTRAFRVDVPPHLATENFMAGQWAAALGHDAALASRNGALFVLGNDEDPAFGSLMTLWIHSASLEEACDGLPPNIQTIGHLASDVTASSWQRHLVGSSVLRFVPAQKMHHFGPVWDGEAFWRKMFQDRRA